MKKALIAYVATLLAFLLLDGLWLGVLMAPTYRELLGSLMLEKPLLVPAAVFYCLYVFGCVVFVVLPSLTWQRAARLGALLGLVAYGTYDLTNWATLRGWSAQLSLMDWAWGTFATALACTVGFWVARRS
ncbi:UNVERIFIED_ORG: putative membrane protein [Pseudomonas fluorescens]|nr:putative membrane protein [Pseudomonas fluorescens]